jgi:multidrug efflux pump subunit AcrA (membrane-fusion protein)
MRTETIPIRMCESPLREILLAGFAALCLLLSGCTEKKAAGEGTAPQALPVQVQLVEAQKITDTTEYLSIMKSRHSAAINPQVEGQITRIFVKLPSTARRRRARRRNPTCGWPRLTWSARKN